MNWFHKDEIKRHYNIEDTIGAGNFADFTPGWYRACGAVLTMQIMFFACSGVFHLSCPS